MVAAVETMAYGRGIPWHGLGVKTATPLSTAEEMLDAAGLLWGVHKEIIRTGRGTEIPGQFATVRDTDYAPLGIVGNAYRVVQNAEAFAWADMLVDDGSAKYETAGSLFGGARIFLSMEIPEGIRVPGDEGEVKPYILVTNSHDGSSPLIGAVVMIRVVCANTLTVALEGATRTFKIRHTGSIDGKIAAAREALGVTFTYMARFEEVAAVLATTSVTDRQADKIFRAAFPVPEMQKAPDRIDQSDFAKVREVYRTSANLDPIRGTAWGVLQASGEYVDHVVDYHGRRFDPLDVRANSLLYGGPAAQRKQKVYNLVRDIPKVKRILVPAVLSRV